MSLSSDGYTLAVGAPMADWHSSGANGYVQVFKLNGSSWEQIGIFNGDDTDSVNDHLGHAVSLSGNGNVLGIMASSTCLLYTSDAADE